MQSSRLNFLARALVLVWLGASAAAVAHGDGPAVATVAAGQVPAVLAVREELGPAPTGVTDLKFREIFRLPVGPQGLEPAERLLSLQGRRVRMVGFMVNRSDAGNASFILAPMPVQISDEDEAQADDIPASAVLVRLQTPQRLPIPNLSGLVRVQGVLHVGNVEDSASGRVFAARIELDDRPARALSKLAADLARSQSRTRQSAP